MYRHKEWQTYQGSFDVCFGWSDWAHIKAFKKTELKINIYVNILIVNIVRCVSFSNLYNEDLSSS